MRTRTALLNICLALLIPLTAGAKKPESEECQLEVASPVFPGIGFEVVVRPAPGAGPWTCLLYTSDAADDLVSV